MITARSANRPDEDICLLLTFDNHKGTYVCDCGTASDLTIKECTDTNAFFISHTHIDHFINFDTFIRHQINSEFHIVLCGPQGLAKSVRSKLQAYNWNLIQDAKEGAMVYEVREYIDENQYLKTLISSPNWEMGEPELVSDENIFHNEKFFVKALPLDHKIVSLSYRFQEFDSVSIDITKSPFKGGRWINELKEAYLSNENRRIINIEENEVEAQSLFHLLEVKKGNSLGFIMDHSPTEDNHQRIAAHFHKVDELYIESFYAHEELETALGNSHSTTGLSGKAAALAKAKKAVPLHFSRKYAKERRKELETEFYDSFLKFSSLGN